MRITIDVAGRDTHSDEQTVAAIRQALAQLEDQGTIVSHDLRWRDSVNVGHVEMDDSVDGRARQFIDRLAHAGISAAEAETLGVAERDHALGVAAWSGIEDTAWAMALEYLRRPKGGTWALISGCRHDGRCPVCLTYMTVKLAETTDGRADHHRAPDRWECGGCGRTETLFPQYLEVAR